MLSWPTGARSEDGIRARHCITPYIKAAVLRPMSRKAISLHTWLHCWQSADPGMRNSLSTQFALRALTNTE